MASCQAAPSRRWGCRRHRACGWRCDDGWRWCCRPRGQSGAAALSGGAAVARGAAAAAGASTAYSLASAGQFGGGSVSSGLGWRCESCWQRHRLAPRARRPQPARASKPASPGGSQISLETTGGSSSMGTIGGESAQVASPAASGGEPARAKRMKRSQSMGHGVSAAAMRCAPATPMAVALPSIFLKVTADEHLQTPRYPLW